MSKSDPILAALGRNVRKRREVRELTQEKLAEKSGLDPTYISDIERGQRNPGIKNVAKLGKHGFTILQAHLSCSFQRMLAFEFTILLAAWTKKLPSIST